MHGGAGSGAPLGNQNAYKHGFYTSEAIQARQALAAVKREAAANASLELTPTNHAAAEPSLELAVARGRAPIHSSEELASSTRAAAPEPSRDLVPPKQDAPVNDGDELVPTTQIGATEPGRYPAAPRHASRTHRNALRHDTAARSSQQPARHPITMSEMMVVDIDNGYRGLGSKKFREMPREGDYVAITDDQGPAAYQVVAVLYAEDGLSPGIDLFVGGRMPSNQVFSHIRNTRS